MSPRVPFAVFLLTAAGAIAACKSSAPYAGPGNVALGTGVAAGAAVVNRAITGECFAACRPGTFCDRTTGLCVEHLPVAHGGAPPPAPSSSARPQPVLRHTPYTAGHEYEVPALGGAEGGPTPRPLSGPVVSTSPNEALACDPASMHELPADAGPIACEPDGAAPSL